MGDKFFQRSLRHAVNIHGIPADKQFERLDRLGWTRGIHAVQGFHIIGAADFCFFPTGRTLTGDIQQAAPGQIPGNLGNNHIRLVHLHPVSNPQFQPPHDTDIVETGPAHRGTLQLHRLKDSHRINKARS